MASSSIRSWVSKSKASQLTGCTARFAHASPALPLLRRQRRDYHALVPGRSVLSATGKDTRTLLQNLVTNDIEKLAKKTSPSSNTLQYTAFLTPAGRVIATAFLYACQKETDVLIDVDTRNVDAVLECIKRFKLRSEIKVEDMTQSMAVSAHWDYDHPPEDAIAAGEDRRAEGMGQRAIVRRTEDADLTSPSKDYTFFRTSMGVAETVEETAGLPLESNLDLMEGVDWRKGCYLGQELTARTWHTGVVRKRVVPVKLYTDSRYPPSDDDLAKMKYEPSSLLPSGSDIWPHVFPEPSSLLQSVEEEKVAPRKPARTRPVGKLLSHVGDVGLAMMRLDQLGKWNKGVVFRVTPSDDPSPSEKTYIRPWLPFWWPNEVKSQAKQI